MDNATEITSRLKFIGKIKRGDEINTRYMYIQPDTLSTTLSRTFYIPDNRTNTLIFCKDVVFRSFELLTTYERSVSDQDKIFYRNLIYDLDSSCQGFENLKFTYSGDIKFCCDMDILIESIKARLQILSDKEINEINNNIIR